MIHDVYRVIRRRKRDLLDVTRFSVDTYRVTVIPDKFCGNVVDILKSVDSLNHYSSHKHGQSEINAV